jgi:hypothetical protein
MKRKNWVQSSGLAAAVGRVLDRHLAVASMFVLALGAIPRSATAGQLIVTPIPDPPGSTETDVEGINNVGQIVGHFFDQNQAGGEHGFIDMGDQFTLIDYPGSTGTAVSGINDAGQMVGAFATTTCGNHPPTQCPGVQGFFFDGSAFTTIDFPGATDTWAHGINNAGTIVGRFIDPSGTQHGFLLDANGFTQIDAPGAIQTGLAGINDAGQMVGGFQDSGLTFHGLFVDVDGTSATIDYPNAIATVLGGINNLGDIDGAFVDASDPPNVSAFLLSSGTFTPLDLPGTFNVLGGINDAEQIDGSFSDSSGMNHGFLTTPVSEP